MRKILFCVAVLSALTGQARLWAGTQTKEVVWTGDDIKEVIRKVNTYWQTNNPAEVRSFWDNAAYHTGNIEVWKLLGDQQMLDYKIGRASCRERV